MNPLVQASATAPPTETVETCLLCGGTDTVPVLEPSVDRLHRLPGDWAIRRCTGCGLARLSPRPVIDEIGFYYPGDYCSFHGPDPSGGGAEASEGGGPASPGGDGVASGPAGKLRKTRTHVRNAVLASAGYVQPHEVPAVYRALTPVLKRAFHMRVFFDWPGFPAADPAPGRALDVGCGAGAFLRLLQCFGWDVAGVELDPEAAALAARTTGREVFSGEVHEAPYEAGSFDFAHLSHVIEHMADPRRSLEAVRELLAPGGSIYLETPNLDAWNARKLGEYWIGYDSPRHLVLFTPGTLRRLVEEAGFAVERVTTRPFPGVYLWEDTYRHEDEIGALTDLVGRPRLRRGRRARAGALGARAGLARLVNRQSADITCLWARRPEGPKP